MVGFTLGTSSFASLSLAQLFHRRVGRVALHCFLWAGCGPSGSVTGRAPASCTLKHLSFRGDLAFTDGRIRRASSRREGHFSRRDAAERGMDRLILQVYISSFSHKYLAGGVQANPQAASPRRVCESQACRLVPVLSL